MLYMLQENYIIFATNKDLSLANTISKDINVELGQMEVKKINGTETFVEIKSHVFNKNIILIHSALSPINDSLMDIFLITDTLLKNGAKTIHLILPYLPYTRILDNQVNKINFNLVVKLLELSGITALYTFDMYSPQLLNVFSVPVYNINIKKIFSTVLEKYKQNRELMVTTLDYELKDRAIEVSKILNTEFVYTTKIDENTPSGFEINKSVNEKDVLLVANRIVSGELIVRFSNFLALKGAKNIFVIATHGLFVDEAIERINDSIIKDVHVFFSPKSKISNKIKVVPYAPIYKEIITRIIENKNLISFIN